jgi:predicted phage terminase large subunit-like protein
MIMGISDKEAYLAAVGSYLKVFLQQSFGTIYPGKEYMDNWHIDAIVHCLMQCVKGQMPRLIINLPPRHLKSFIVSVVLPAFILGRDPTAKIICISYSDDLAKQLARDFRRIVESEWYPKIFPHVRPSKITENEFVTDEGGFRYATSVGGTLTGRGGDFIIVDDPIKPEDAYSDKARGSNNEWYKSTLLSRLDDKKRSVLILAMQRLHVNDLTGFAESSGGFHKLSFPALAIRDERIPMSDTDEYLRLQGEPLHQEREDVATLEKIRDEIGSSIFSSQYQQHPECPEGALIKRKYIKVIDQPPRFRAGGHFWVSIDSALSTSDTADYSAITLGYSDEDGHYVLFAERGRWDFETLLAKVLQYAKRYRNITFIVEAAGSGISLLQYLRKAGLNHFSHRPKQDKVVRAAYVLPIYAAGRVYIVSQEGANDWVEPLINELVSFPNGRFDDQVDSLTQALRWAEQRVNSGSKFYAI